MGGSAASARREYLRDGQEKGATTRIPHSSIFRHGGARRAIARPGPPDGDGRDRCGIPLLSIVDSAGAYPHRRVGARQAEAIARSTDACCVRSE